MSDSRLYLAELTVYDPGIAGTKTLRYCTGTGFVTATSETPSDTYYDPRIKQPAALKRDIFADGRTYGASRDTPGELVLLNGDGSLDALIDYGFDGRSVTIRRGVQGAAYPSGFTTVLVATMEQAEFTSTDVRVKLRDRIFELNKPLQPTKYAGTNSLPSGLEGVSDIKGKPKPICYGQVFNVPAVCVNTAKLIFQVAAVASGVACNSIDAVYDRGIPLFIGFPLTSVSLTWAGFGGDYGGGYYAFAGAQGVLYPGVQFSADGDTWTLPAVFSGGSSPFTATVNDVVYGNSLWVAVGHSGEMATSPDRTTWTSRTSQFGSDHIRAVAYANGLYVAVGASGKVSTSSNGTSWTARTSGVATDLLDVHYFHGVFIAAGASGVILTSPDGITWTARTSNVSVTLNRINSSSTTVVVVGNSGTVVVSPDAVSWTPVTLTTTQNLAAVAYGNGIFIASGGAVALTSIDGHIWTQQTTGASSLATTALIFGVDRFIFSSSSVETYRTSGSAGTYANTTDLADDSLAPSPGTIKTYAAGGYFRLGSSPAGLVTADVTQGAASSNRTAGQIWKQLVERAGYTSSDYSTSDITALDTANSAVIGLWVNEESTFSDAMDKVAGSVGAWWGPDKTGLFRIKQLTAPSGTAVATFTANDFTSFERVTINDTDKGLPAYRSTVRYAKVYAVQDTDLAAGVSDDRRAVVSQEWREAYYEDTSVQTAHLLSPALIDESLIAGSSDATTEAQRRQVLRGTRKDMFIGTAQLDDTNEAIDLGSVVSISSSRYGLSGGKLFRVIGVDPNPADDTVTFTFWG